MARPDRSRERKEFINRPLIEQVKDLFSLHSGERRGSIIMIAILMILLVVFVFKQWFQEPMVTDMEPLRAEMEAWLASRDSADAEPERSLELFRFDPNMIELSDWIRLGLSDRQAQGIDRWRRKGGRFRVKSDLSRMYSLRPEQVELLLPYVDLPDSLPAKGRSRSNENHARTTITASAKEPRIINEDPAPAPEAPKRSVGSRHPVEVNSADTTALIALPGIGPSFARGIVKYRESLGGYHSLDQLAEVYVLKDKPDALVRMRELLVVDTLMVRRIPLNTCTVEELAAHPYFRWRLAKPIIAYRQQHGHFREVAGIRAIPLIDEDLYRKLAPYLSVE